MSLFPYVRVNASVIDSGTCGDNLSWELDGEGVFTISGTGSMTDYDRAPWYDIRNSIKSVDISSGVTSIGRFAFKDCSSLTSITIPDSVSKFGDYAFESSTSLASITIPDSTDYIGFSVFSDCTKLETVSISNRLFYSKDNHDATLKSLTSEKLNLYNSVDFSTGENGTVGIASRDYETGIVTLYVNPDSDYQVGEITVTDSNGNSFS